MSFSDTLLGPGMRRLVTIRKVAGVWFFYAMIHIWNLPTTGLTVSERNRFFLITVRDLTAGGGVRRIPPGPRRRGVLLLRAVLNTPRARRAFPAAGLCS